MKIFLTVLLLIFILFIVLLLGNMLRCTSSRNGACPGWCLTKKVQCLTSDCTNKFVCQAPGFGDYVGLIDHWREDQWNKFKK